MMLPMILFAAALTVSTGCGSEREVSPIEPAPSSQEVNNPELGPPPVDPLSFGPGEKYSPSWSPSGGRVAFIVDGYVSEKPLSSEGATRRTTRDIEAERVMWPASSSEELIILGEGVSSESTGEDYDTHPLYVTRSEEGQLKIESLTEDVLTVSTTSSQGSLIAALESGAYESRTSTVDPETGELDTYPSLIEGRVTEVSVSPDGGQALAAVVVSGSEGSDRYEIHTFDLESGESKRVARLAKGMEIFGAPQQTSDGIYYVAGERESKNAQAQGSNILYNLYHLPEGSSSPERASAVGQDFIASSIKVSPQGNRLAILGRRDSGSTTNLYVLDLSDESLYSATVNESMEIKTSVDSLDWHPDGKSVVIVARSDISGPRVYDGSASSLLKNFYNLYKVPVDDLEERA